MLNRMIGVASDFTSCLRRGHAKMNEHNTKQFRLLSFAQYRRALIVAVALMLAGGGTVMLSAQSLPPVVTDPVVIAAALKSCDAGDYEDCYIYGRAIAAKSTTQDDLIRAYERIEKACDGGVVNACFGAGRRHAMGLGVKIDSKKARDYEQRGCNGGDERACAVLKRFETPPPSADGLTGLPAPAQGNVYAALYFEPNGAELLAHYADNPYFDKDPNMKWNLTAAACEMGNWKACQNAALAFTEVQGFNGQGKKDMSRAIRMAKIGCAGDDALSCHILGLVLISSNNSIVTNEAQAAYKKAYPGFLKLCEAGNGYYCDALAYYYNGIAFTYDGAKVEFYYSKGCDAGFQKHVRVMRRRWTKNGNWHRRTRRDGSSRRERTNTRASCGEPRQIIRRRSINAYRRKMILALKSKASTAVAMRLFRVPMHGMRTTNVGNIEREANERVSHCSILRSGQATLGAMARPIGA